MKRVSIILSFVFTLSILLSACSSPSASSGADASQPSQSASKGVEVNKGLLSVSITMPAYLFSGQTKDEVVASAKEQGIDDVTANADGSYTYKISKAKHAELMKSMKNEVVASIDKMKSGGDYKSYKDITYNDDFSEINLIVDQKAYESGFESFGVIGLVIDVPLPRQIGI